MTYLRTTMDRRNIDLNPDEAGEIFEQVSFAETLGFQSQPGFIRYQLQGPPAVIGDDPATWAELGSSLLKLGLRRHAAVAKG